MKKLILFALVLTAVFFVATPALAMTEQERQALITQIQAQINQLIQLLNQMLTTQGLSVSIPTTPVVQQVQTTCTPNWIAGTWGSCVNGIQSRPVADAMSCGISDGKPASAQTCISTSTTTDNTSTTTNTTNTNTAPTNTTITTPTVCVPNWYCGAWEACGPSGTQDRICQDLAKCGDILKIETTSCVFAVSTHPKYGSNTSTGASSSSNTTASNTSTGASSTGSSSDASKAGTCQSGYKQYWTGGGCYQNGYVLCDSSADKTFLEVIHFGESYYYKLGNNYTHTATQMFLSMGGQCFSVRIYDSNATTAKVKYLCKPICPSEKLYSAPVSSASNTNTSTSQQSSECPPGTKTFWKGGACYSSNYVLCEINRDVMSNPTGLCVKDVTSGLHYLCPNKCQ